MASDKVYPAFCPRCGKLLDGEGRCVHCARPPDFCDTCGGSCTYGTVGHTSDRVFWVGPNNWWVRWRPGPSGTNTISLALCRGGWQRTKTCIPSCSSTYRRSTRSTPHA